MLEEGGGLGWLGGGVMTDEIDYPLSSFYKELQDNISGVLFRYII